MKKLKIQNLKSKWLAQKIPAKVDLIAKLLDFCLEDIVVQIFLTLDCSSLHNAKQVCKLWNNIIKAEMWNRNVIRSMLRRRHLQKWLDQDIIKEFDINILCRKGEYVTSLACDDLICIVGLSEGLAKVYSLSSGDFITLLNCKYDQYDLSTPAEELHVSIDIGDQVIVTGTSEGVVIVRNKKTFGAFYKEYSHGDTPIMDIKVVPGSSYVMTCSRQEIFVMKHVKRMVSSENDNLLGEYMDVVDKIFLDYYGVITCFASDGILLIIGTSNTLLVYDLISEAMLYKIASDFTTSLHLSSPYILRVGSSPCIEIRDVSTGDVLKTISDNYFHCISSNGRFLCAPESQRNTALRNVDHFNRNIYRSHVGLWDIQDICNLYQESGFEWKKVFVFDKPGFGYSAINRTCLLTCINKKIVCRRFAH